MSNETDTANLAGGIFAAMLTVLFVGLKLTGKIDWSWWWVFAPMWLPTTVMLAVAGLVFIGIAIYSRTVNGT